MSDENRIQTREALNAVKNRLIERIGPEDVQLLEGAGFSITWEDEVFIMQETNAGTLKIEFSKTLAQEFIEGVATEPTVELKLNDHVRLKLHNLPDSTNMYGIWNAQQKRDDGERAHTIEHLFIIVDELFA